MYWRLALSVYYIDPHLIVKSEGLYRATVTSQRALNRAPLGKRALNQPESSMVFLGKGLNS